MVFNRLLDAFFKTLDVVDSARDRIDGLLGRQPRPDPWAVDWPTPQADDDDAPDAKDHTDKSDAKKSVVEDTDKAKKTEAKKTDEDKDAKKAPAKKPTPPNATAKPMAKKPVAKKPVAKKTEAKKTEAKKTVAKSKAGGKKSRKGSIDRSGKDFTSPRATSVAKVIAANNTAILHEDADYNGKKVLGRVLWALLVAEQAGEKEGLTTADTSALLHLVAQMDVFSTNVGRACRDHDDLITTGKQDGRSKRYVLTAAGRTAATSVSMTT